MTKNELDLLLHRIDALQADLKDLDLFIRDHMKSEEATVSDIDKRLAKLEWRANTASAVVGGIVAAVVSWFSNHK